MHYELTYEGIDVGEFDADPETWNGRVESSPQGTVFHRYEFLSALAEWTGTTLHPLVGRKGQEPVGVFPVFERSWGVVTAAFSPPPGAGMSQLGPAIYPLDGFNQRTAEKRVRRFTGGCLDWVERFLDPSYVNLRTHWQYPDHRPFAWNDFDLTPRYTYLVDLSSGVDDVLDGFSGDARRNVRSTPDEAYAIETGGPDAIRRIVEHLRRRHAEQGLRFPVDAEFVLDVASELPDDRVTAYVCRVDGDYASGLIVLSDDDVTYRWQGGARPAGGVDVPVNDLLDWRVVRDSIEAGRERYDLVGANTPGLCEYKAKFGPDLATYHVAERGTRTARIAAGVYQSAEKTGSTVLTSIYERLR